MPTDHTSTKSAPHRSLGGPQPLPLVTANSSWNSAAAGGHQNPAATATGGSDSWARQHPAAAVAVVGRGRIQPGWYQTAAAGASRRGGSVGGSGATAAAGGGATDDSGRPAAVGGGDSRQ